MDQDMLFSTCVLQRLLKHNRPATDVERTIIVESMAPTKAKLNAVEEQISDIMAVIGSLKLKVGEAEIKLQRLREEEASILETFADHDRALSPFRTLPDDILREICAACVQNNIPVLSPYGPTPMPYIMGQICSGIRHVVLTTPGLWASMSVDISRLSPKYLIRLREETHEERMEIHAKKSAVLARRATEWFERAGGLALTVIIHDASSLCPTLDESSDADPTSVLYDALLSYSTRWREIKFISYHRAIPTPIIRIAGLTAADVPLLQSVSLRFADSNSNSVLLGSEFLTISTLRHLSLKNAVPMFTVNWAVLTTAKLHGTTKNEIGRILQQAKGLVSCKFHVPHSYEHYPHKINLPFLRILIISEYHIGDIDPNGAHSILEAITAPVLDIFENHVGYLDLSLLDFLKRSPHIRKLSLLYFDSDVSLMKTTELLRHCPSLAILSLQANVTGYGRSLCNADQFLRAFVEKGNDGVICPRLQDFNCEGDISISLETLRVFLEGRGDITTVNVLPWKRVAIDISGIRSEGRQEIVDLVSEKKAAGLDVHVHT